MELRKSVQAQYLALKFLYLKRLVAGERSRREAILEPCRAKRMKALFGGMVESCQEKRSKREIVEGIEDMNRCKLLRKYFKGLKAYSREVRAVRKARAQLRAGKKQRQFYAWHLVALHQAQSRRNDQVCAAFHRRHLKKKVLCFLRRNCTVRKAQRDKVRTLRKCFKHWKEYYLKKAVSKQQLIKY